MSRPDRPVTRARPAAWTAVGALVTGLTVLTVLVTIAWTPLVDADVRTVLAAHAAVSGHAVAITVLVAITNAGSPVAVAVLTAAAAAVLIRRRLPREATYVVLVWIVALTAETAVKHGVARPRPFMVEPLTTAAGFSFPSGHTTGTTALCASLLVVLVPVLHRRGRVLAAGVAVLAPSAVAASRVLLGVHYPSDVAASVMIGILVAVLLAVLLSRPTSAGGPQRGHRKTVELSSRSRTRQ